MGHRMIQGEIVVQILMQLEKNWKLHCGEVHNLLKKTRLGPRGSPVAHLACA